MEEKGEDFIMSKRKNEADNNDQQDDFAKNLVDSGNHVNCEDKGCLCSFVPKRYMVTFWAMFGFFNAYALRVNLSVAMVAMVNNVTYHGHAVEVKVRILIIQSIEIFCWALITLLHNRRKNYLTSEKV